MNKNVKKVINLLLAVMLVFGMSTSVFADVMPPNLGDVVDGSVLTDDNVSEVEIYNPARGNILNRGIARITNNGDGTVNVYGAVMGAVVCDKLQLVMTLQRLEGGYWTDIKTYSTSSSNSSLLTKSYNREVQHGYYYRVKAACVATKGSTSESQMPVTDGIWI